MKGGLPQKINTIECGIINLENSDQEGSHWTAYYMNNGKKNIISILTETLLPQNNYSSIWVLKI